MALKMKRTLGSPQLSLRQVSRLRLNRSLTLSPWIVDLAAVSPDTLRTLIEEEPKKHMILLDEKMHGTNADMARYGGQMEFLGTLARRTLFRADGFDVLRLEQQ
jgi:hypothetical protein